MRFTSLLAVACLPVFVCLAPGFALAQTGADTAGKPRLSLGFASSNSDATINADVDAKFDCPGVVFDIRFSANVKSAVDAEQALARATPIVVQKFKPYREFCLSPAPKFVTGAPEESFTLMREALHVTGGFYSDGVSGAFSIFASCPAMTTELRAGFSGVRTKQEALDQAKASIDQQASALKPYCH